MNSSYSGRERLAKGGMDVYKETECTTFYKYHFGIIQVSFW
jgi:hypothetical protein